ncbi:hypothetical protein O988_01979, partial [Pseudogymnoascus sp. VKM F-3808]
MVSQIHHVINRVLRECGMNSDEDSALDVLPKACVQDNVIHDAYQYKVREVGYNFDEINAFKGPPVDEVDKQWDLLLNGVHTVRLSRTELERMNMSSIQLADGSEDYIAVPIAYHMLHCLYNIYRYAHPDFFGEDPNGPEWIVTHTDHCIDNLRQFVQCHGGNGFETYRWLDNRKLPWPVVSTDEVCIDWPHFDGWVRDHGVSSHDMHEQQLLVHPKFGPIYDADLSLYTAAAVHSKVPRGTLLPPSDHSNPASSNMQAPTTSLLRWATRTTSAPTCRLCARASPKATPKKRMSTTTPLRAQSLKPNVSKKARAVKPLPY